MKGTFTLLLCILSVLTHAQKETYDIISFTPPKGWKRDNLENVLSLTTTDNKTRTWAQIGIIKSTASKGSIDTDFESEWKELIVKPYQQYGISEQPLGIDTQSVNGWKVWTGIGQFVFNKDTSSVLLTTFSDGVRCASLKMMCNSANYSPALDQFLASVQLPDAASSPAKKVVNPVTTTTSTPVATGFQFNTTNFDDGWTSIVKEDWVEATKGEIKVLLHYPREEEKKYYPQYSEHVSVFWNLLVAPRYSNLRNYESPSHLLSWQPGLFAAGLLTDKVTGKDVWVALFSKGKTGWLEVIAPDKKTFVENFGVDQPAMYFDEWDRMLKLFGLNKFAVGENDLVGKWSNNFSSSTAYYNVYSGLYAGSGTFGSASSFEFGTNKTYRWQLAMGQSQPGTTMKVDQAKSSGNWKLLNNWQIWFSEIERKPRKYNAYFSCIKGARILWLQDTEYGDYTAYGKVNN